MHAAVSVPLLRTNFSITHKLNWIMHTGTELVVSYLAVVCSLQVHVSKYPIRRHAGLPETAGVIEAAGLIEIYSDRYLQRSEGL